MITIAVDDVVFVTLNAGLFLQNYIVKSVPGNNEVYWEFEDPVTTERVVVGPSVQSIRKLS